MVEQSLNIFVSYKSKDQAIAETFKTLLYGVLVPDKQKLLDVFISNGIPKGEDWEKSIHEALRKCDCFILLYTDPKLEWTWCLYESGFYIGKRLDDGKLNRKYIILHSPDTKPPAPLTWARLIERLKQMHERNFELSGWERALGRAIVDAIEGNDFVPELPLFRAYNGKSYHSTLQILDRFSDSLFGIDVIFVELLPEQDPRPEGTLGRLSYMLTVSRHFRWGVCEPSLKEVARIENAPASPSESRQQLKHLAANLKTGIDRALHEGVREYNLLDRRISIDVCIDEADRQEMANIFTVWEDMFPSLLAWQGPRRTLSDRYHRCDNLRAMRAPSQVARPPQRPARTPSPGSARQVAQNLYLFSNDRVLPRRAERGRAMPSSLAGEGPREWSPRRTPARPTCTGAQHGTARGKNKGQAITVTCKGNAHAARHPILDPRGLHRSRRTRAAHGLAQHFWWRLAAVSPV